MLSNNSSLDKIRFSDGYFAANDFLDEEYSIPIQKSIIKDFLSNSDVEHLCKRIRQDKIAPHFVDKDQNYWMVPEVIIVFLVWLEPDLFDVFNKRLNSAPSYESIIKEMLFSLNS